ncbi:MAG: NAD(P)-binding domain-containing protein, partial [Actinomycetes bacterium]
MSSDATRLKVSVIGAGPVGISIAKAISDAGHTLSAIATTDPARAAQVETVLPGVAVLPVIDAVQGVDLVLFAIPGDQIADLITGLVATESLCRGQLLAHTSPNYGYSVFDEALGLGILPMAIHPAIKFTGFSSIDRARIVDSYIAVDAPK